MTISDERLAEMRRLVGEISVGDDPDEALSKLDAVLSSIEQEQEPATHQARVAAWMLECFGPEITKDRIERADRFVEEALELAQSIGWTADRGHALVDYVFGRPVGEVGQEVGGVMVTLAALCNVFEIDIDAEAKREVDRITEPDIVLKIRAKQASKPTGSALPIALSPSVREWKVTEDMLVKAMTAFVGQVRDQDPDWVDESGEEGEVLLTSPEGDYFALEYPLRAALTASLKEGV